MDHTHTDEQTTQAEFQDRTRRDCGGCRSALPPFASKGDNPSVVQQKEVASCSVPLDSITPFPPFAGNEIANSNRLH